MAGFPLTTRLVWISFLWWWNMLSVLSLFLFFKHFVNVIKLLFIVLYDDQWQPFYSKYWFMNAGLHFFFHVIFIFCRFKNLKQQSWCSITVGSLYPFSFSFECFWFDILIYSSFLFQTLHWPYRRRVTREGPIQKFSQMLATVGGTILRRILCSPTLCQTSSAAFFSFFFLSWPNVAACVLQTYRQSSQWRHLAKPNTCSLSFIWLLSHSPLSVFLLPLHHQSDVHRSSVCLSEGLCWMFCSLEDFLRYQTCVRSVFFLMDWTLRWFINWGENTSRKGLTGIERKRFESENVSLSKTKTLHLEQMQTLVIFFF